MLRALTSLRAVRAPLPARSRVSTVRQSANQPNPPTHSFVVETGVRVGDSNTPFTVVNPIAPIRLRNPALLLLDRYGTRRFFLEYAILPEPKHLVIESVQRFRTTYSPAGDGERVRWDRSNENLFADILRQTLGVHPTEFLTAEFIRRCRGELALGWTLFLRLPTKGSTVAIYKPLRDRFFARRPNDAGLYALNPNRAHVKKILSAAA